MTGSGVPPVDLTSSSDEKLNERERTIEALAKALWAYEGPPDEPWEAVDKGPTRDPIRAKASVLLDALTTLDPWYVRAVQAETLLWALSVWLDPAGNPYAQRDLDAANALLKVHGLTDPDALRNRLMALHDASGPPGGEGNAWLILAFAQRS